MPAYAEEVDAAIEEGIRSKPWSPRPNSLHRHGHEGRRAGRNPGAPGEDSRPGRPASGIDCVRNTLGDIDASGRGRPVPLPGTEFHLPLDTLIVAIGERPTANARRHGHQYRKGRPGRGGGPRYAVHLRVPACLPEAIWPRDPIRWWTPSRQAERRAGIIDRYLRARTTSASPCTATCRGFLEPSAVEAYSPRNRGADRTAHDPARRAKRLFCRGGDGV